MKKGLSPKNRKFVAEYLKDQNGTQAAIRAGYSKKTAASQAYDLLRKPEIAKAIELSIRQAEQKAIVDKSYVLTTLKEVTERCMTHTPVMEFDHAAGEMVQKKAYIDDPDHPGQFKQVGVFEFDSNGANGALRMLGQSLKLFTDKVEHEFSEGSFERLERARRKANGLES